MNEQVMMGDIEVDPDEGMILPGDDVFMEVDEDGEVISMSTDEGDGDEPPRYDEGFNENLALSMSESERTALALEIMELVDADDESRKAWQQRLVDGLTVLGVEDVPEDRLPFPRASRITHPVLVEVMTQFQSRAIEELFPPGGPTKGVVLGEPDEELIEQSERVEMYMNYHLTEADEDYFADTDQMTFALPYEGSIFRKVCYDWELAMPTARYVSSLDFIVPYDARSLRAAPRYTHRFPFPINDIKRRQADGVYVDYEIAEQAIDTRENADQELRDESDKREPTQPPEADTLTLYESHINLDPSFDPLVTEDLGYKLPYIVTIDNENQQILSIRRNWKEGDEDYRKRIWFAHYKYLPGLGFYGWGIMHVIGSLGVGASGVIRALLDSALRQNAGGGFVSKDFRGRGNFDIEPGVYKEVDASPEEIAKGFHEYPMPSGQGQQALFNLLEILIGGVKSFSAITESLTGEASNTGPVGTTIALIEQSMKVFSAIHKRMHNALRQELKMLGELFHETMPDRYPYRVKEGDQYLLRDDFDDRIDIAPVSDPNIFSSTQRIAIAQAVYQLVTTDQTGAFDEHSAHEAIKRLLQALRVPEIESILPDKEAKRLDPVSENQNFMVGKPVRAFIDQNHPAHLMVHEGFLQELAMGDPETANAIAPIIQAHMAQHKAYLYRVQMQTEILQLTGEMMPPYDMMDRQEEELSPEEDNLIAEIAAMIVQQQAMQLAQQQAEQQAAQQQAEQEAQMAPEQQKMQMKQAGFEQDQAMKQAGFEADQQRKAKDHEQKQQLSMMDKIKEMVGGFRGQGGGGDGK